MNRNKLSVWTVMYQRLDGKIEHLQLRRYERCY